MATGKPFGADARMTVSLTRTSAWVNRAGVVLDPATVFGNIGPAPGFGSVGQPGSEQNGQGAFPLSGEELATPSDIAGAVLQRDTSADHAEQQQAKEQARLLQRFQQLKQWQQQQQDKLLRQQQEQLQMLRLEQQRVEQTLVAQRQKQWGGIQQIQQSPPRAKPVSHPPRNPSTSPARSTVPDALAKASISLGKTAGPMVLNPLLDQAQNHTRDNMVELKPDQDLASDVASSVVEEGIYPLPETPSNVSSGFLEDQAQTATPGSNARGEGELEEEEEMAQDSSLDESLQDAVSLNLKVSSSGHTTPASGDDRPIQSALGTKAKTFEELLEQELRMESEKYSTSETHPPPAVSGSPPRRSFLRKGSGTARFGVVTKKPPKPPSPRTAHQRALPSHEAKGTLDKKTTTAGKSEGSKRVVQKVTPAGMNKLSLVRSEKDPGREDGKRGQDKNSRGRKEDAPQMARKVASKPPMASKPLSKQVLNNQQQQLGSNRRHPSLMPDGTTSQPTPTVKPSQEALSKVVLAGDLPERLGSLRSEAANKVPAVIVDEVVPRMHNDAAVCGEVAREGALPDDTIEISFQMRMNEWELNDQVEQEELDEFELLEEAADDNASFASDASVVVKMMQRAHQQNGRQGGPTNTLQVPSKSAMTQKFGQLRPILSAEIETNFRNLPRRFMRRTDKILEASQEDSFEFGDQTLTGDNEDDYGLNDEGHERPLRQGETEGRRAGSATEEDSDEMLGESRDGFLKASRRSVEHSEENLFKEHATENRRYNGPAIHEQNLEQSSDIDDDSDEDPKQVNNDHDNSGDESDRPSQAMKRKAATSSHAVDVDFDDDESWGDFGDNSLESSDEEGEEDGDDSVILAGAPFATSTPPHGPLNKGQNSVLDQRKDSAKESSLVNHTASPPTSSLVSKLFPRLKPTQKTSQPTQVKEQPVQRPLKAPEQPSVAEGLQSKLLKEKLVELEAEIAKFRRENTALAKLREEREKGLAALDKEVVDFQKQKAEELKNLQDFKEEEMKKLRKEKRIFEKYQKAVRALPDKKDREEIELLKKQLSDLQDEISRRETRWTAASTRLRDRIDILEKENEELREEMKLLEKQRLQAWKREEEKVKSSLAAKPKKQPPVINKQKVPPLLSVSTDPEPKPDPMDTAEESRRDITREKPKTPHQGPTQPQVTNHKLDTVAAEQRTVESSSDDDGPSSSKPRRPSQRKRSVRFAEDSSPTHHQQPATTTTGLSEQSLDLLSPTRDDDWAENEPLSSSPVGRADSVVGRKEVGQANRSANNSNREDEKEVIHHPDGKIEDIRSDSSRVITYSNQTRKEISADGQSVIVTFFNGDVKQIMPDQRVMYYYSETQATHTTYPDGLEIIQFNNNQTEKHYPNGTKEITFPDQTIKYLFPNGNEESIFPDGTVLRAEKNGDKTMEFPDGQREVHTAQYKRREYPDGTVKTVYPDGRQETRYASGRIRVKDKEGRIILDKK